MGGSRGRKQSMPEAHRRELPPDMIFSQILPRLQVKSLFRFKCVSKEWHSFITTPAFAKMQLHHATTIKLVALSTTKPYNFFTMNCERPQDGFTASPFPFEFAPQCESPRIPLFLASAHGLLCVGIPKLGMNKLWIGYSNLILWNPATNDHKILSKPPTSFSCCYFNCLPRFGFYYSSCDDDYKLVHVTHITYVYIYSLKSDSWRKVDSDFHNIHLLWHWYFWSSETQQSRVSANGTLYFLEVNHKRRGALSIVMFNTKTETLKLIETPDFEYRKERVICLNFKVERDECIHMLVNISSGSVYATLSSRNKLSSRNELWRMDREGYWTMLEKYSLTSGGNFAGLRPMHLMMNGNLLTYNLALGRVYQRDWKTGSLDSLSYPTQSMRVCWHEGLEYTETMVSPNQYTN